MHYVCCIWFLQLRLVLALRLVARKLKRLKWSEHLGWRSTASTLVPFWFHAGAGLLTCFVFTRVSESCLARLPSLRTSCRLFVNMLGSTSSRLRRHRRHCILVLELFRLCFGRLGLVICALHRWIEELFGHLDADGDGAIDEEEWCFYIMTAHAFSFDRSQPVKSCNETVMSTQEFVSFFATVDKAGAHWLPVIHMDPKC